MLSAALSAVFRNVVCCFFARIEIENGNILLLHSCLIVSSSMKESQKFIFSQNFPLLVACKTSKFVTKETLLLLSQTPWYLLKPPINFISRWGDSLTYVGYNFSQVKIFTFNTSRWNAPQCYYWIALCITLMRFYSLRQLGWQQNKNALFCDSTWLFDN